MCIMEQPNVKEILGNDLVICISNLVFIEAQKFKYVYRQNTFFVAFNEQLDISKWKETRLQKFERRAWS